MPAELIKYYDVAVWFCQQHARGLVIVGLLLLMLFLMWWVNCAANRAYKRDIVAVPDIED